jgi:leucyl-tRNA synthetase
VKNIVVMFPYPSGAGLHIGHYYNYAIIDSYCRFLRFCGEEVIQPFGYDAFGLPAENYARSIGGDPKTVTLENIDCFRTQMARMNTQYDERLVTCEPSYTKWTQWLFTKLRGAGLAYKAFGPVNWCPSCETVLANEQVVDSKCDRCKSPVSSRDLEQWYFKTTAYKDRLIKGLDHVDYPAGTIKQQKAWLARLQDWCVSRQRKWGCPIPVEGETDTLDTFVDSSFYYLRYLTKSDDEFLPAYDYKPVDLYVGGAEHACMHLIYARFIHYFLFDIGVVPQLEPFNKVIHQGMITRNGAKMGKSAGNALRMFLMFLGPYTQGGDWNDQGIMGIRRFLNKMRSWLNEASLTDGKNIKGEIHRLRQDIRQAFDRWKVNNIVSGFMKFYNQNKDVVISQACATKIVNLLRNFAPGFQL